MSNRTTLAQLANMQDEEVRRLPIERVAMLAEDIADERARIKALSERVDAEMLRRFGEAARVKRVAAGKDAGTVTLTTKEGHKIKADQPRKVEWDQGILAAAVKEIRTWGDPSEYVTTEYKVAESKYAAWPAAIRDLFTPARTVSHGRAAFKVEIKGSAA